ncbi:MAG: archaeal proteasome endopeptidase complex subunit beta [Methanosarcinales archaeon]|nr:MAG: archaeal proteasome endopeptidase complex subunit beta [Methanosarcinales archaeon]
MVSDNRYKGTTTVGLVCGNGVVLASEKRATMGTFIASRDAKKIYQVDDRIGMTTAGAVGDAQVLARIITIEAKLYKIRRGEPMAVGAVSTLLSNILSTQRYFPYMTQLIIGGVDTKGSRLFSLDPLGGQIEETKVVATGSGSPIAYGILEDRYKDDMSLDEGVNLAIRALHAAIKRDAASGDGIEVVTITPDKYRVLGEEELSKRASPLA